jgi:hypothetical protein
MPIRHLPGKGGKGVARERGNTPPQNSANRDPLGIPDATQDGMSPEQELLGTALFWLSRWPEPMPESLRADRQAIVDALERAREADQASQNCLRVWWESQTEEEKKAWAEVMGNIDYPVGHRT